MNYIISWEDRPVITLTEAVMVLGLSPSTIRRRIRTGQLKQVERANKKEMIQIFTKSISQYLQEAE